MQCDTEWKNAWLLFERNGESRTVQRGKYSVILTSIGGAPVNFNAVTRMYSQLFFGKRTQSAIWNGGVLP